MKETVIINESNKNHKLYIRSKDKFMQRCAGPGKCYKNSIRNFSEITLYICTHYACVTGLPPIRVVLKEKIYDNTKKK